MLGRWTECRNHRLRSSSSSCDSNVCNECRMRVSCLSSLCIVLRKIPLISCRTAHTDWWNFIRIVWIVEFRNSDGIYWEISCSNDWLKIHFGTHANNLNDCSRKTRPAQINHRQCFNFLAKISAWRIFIISCLLTDHSHTCVIVDTTIVIVYCYIFIVRFLDYLMSLRIEQRWLQPRLFVVLFFFLVNRFPLKRLMNAFPTASVTSFSIHSNYVIQFHMRGKVIHRLRFCSMCDCLLFLRTENKIRMEITNKKFSSQNSKAAKTTSPAQQ